MKRIYIEGENNPGLRKAFTELLKQELGRNMPKIVLGDGISQTIDKFRKAPLEKDEERFLLVDSDEPLTDKADLVRRVNEEKCNQKKSYFRFTSRTGKSTTKYVSFRVYLGCSTLPN